MSSITSVTEAEDALCEGQFFQVEGVLIDPDDVVRLDTSGENPRFLLSDGSTVTHDPLKKGDAGDYLAQAIQKARRPETQSEKQDPRLFAWGWSNYTKTRYNWYNTKINDSIEGIGFQNDLVTFGDVSGSNGRVLTYEIDGRDISTVGAKIAETDLSNLPLSMTVSDIDSLSFSRNLRYMFVQYSGTHDRFSFDTQGDASAFTADYTGAALPQSNGLGMQSALDGPNVLYAYSTYYDEIKKFSLSTAHDWRTASLEQSQSGGANQPHTTGRDIDGNTVYIFKDTDDTLKTSILDGSDLSTILPYDYQTQNTDFVDTLRAARDGSYIHLLHANDILQFKLNP